MQEPEELQSFDASGLGLSALEHIAPDVDPMPEPIVPERERVEAPPPEEEVEPEEEDEEEGLTFEEPPGPPPTEKLYAGRYQRIEDLEKGYTELQSVWTRDRQQLLQLQQRQQMLEQAMTQLVPILEQQLAERDPEALEKLRQQQLVQQQAAQMAQQVVAPLQTQLEMQARQQAVEGIIREFRARHPDAAPGTEVDRKVAEVVQELDLNPANLESLEVAYEATRDQYLYRVLKANPAFVDTDEGLSYARIQARLLEGLEKPPVPQRQPKRTTAYVERGEGGAPARAASAKGLDEFDEALMAWEKERKGPLFGG